MRRVGAYTMLPRDLCGIFLFTAEQHTERDARSWCTCKRWIPASHSFWHKRYDALRRDVLVGDSFRAEGRKGKNLHPLRAFLFPLFLVEKEANADIRRHRFSRQVERSGCGISMEFSCCSRRITDCIRDNVDAIFPTIGNYEFSLLSLRTCRWEI